MTMPSDTRVAPWRTIGKDIDGLSYSEALVEAGLDYEVYDCPVDLKIAVGVDDSVTRRLDNKRLTYRSDTFDPLGIVGNRYQITQMRELESVMNTLLGDGWEPISAGSLLHGRQAFMVGRIPFKSISGEFDANLGVVNSFDGSTGVRFVTTPLRPRCCNAIGLMLKNAKSSFTLRHTSSITDRIGEARQALGLADAYYKAFDQEIEKLLEFEVSPGTPEIEAVMDNLVPPALFMKNMNEGRGEWFDKESMNPITERSARLRENKRDGIMRNWLTSDTIEDNRHTGWGLLNAVNEWEQWVRNAKSVNARAERNLKSQFHLGGSLTEKTHSKLLELVTAV